MKKFFKRVAAHLGDFRKVSEICGDLGDVFKSTGLAIQKICDLFEEKDPQE